MPTPSSAHKLLWPQTYLPHQHSTIPQKNTTEMNRETLIAVLEYMSSLLEVEFRGITVRLVAHGGACMLLHPGLYDLAQRKQTYHIMRGEAAHMRKTTRDVDYIRRGFIQEYVGKFKIPDAEQRLQRCILGTAARFGLGSDWMNADADVALPMARSQTGAPIDPIYYSSTQQNNVNLYTVFTSKNRKLTIVSVTPAWAVAFKLARYAKLDPPDICLLLMNGTKLAKTRWTLEVVWTWITKECSAMGYAYWDQARLMQMRSRIEHAILLVNSITMPP
ncbi:hypothetical protein PM082_018704 [Marasmius tenuissimus]|nr:hypothetical protein PM082_018704 [Marasmius tenuissimus]